MQSSKAMLTFQDQRIYKSALPLLMWTVSTHKLPGVESETVISTEPLFSLELHIKPPPEHLSLFRGISNASQPAGLVLLLYLQKRTYRSLCEEPVLFNVDTYQVWSTIFQIWKAFTMLSASTEPECCWTDEK